LKTTLQFFKDMGVCDGAYQTLQRFFDAAGITTLDYTQGYQLMLGMMDEIAVEAAQSADPNHATAQGWLKWTYELRTRPEAIMYFGDHIEENFFVTLDGFIHESLDAAVQHRKRVFDELRADYTEKLVVNGVITHEDQTETWQRVDLSTEDLSRYDSFVWHDHSTGLNNKTDSAEEAAARLLEQQKILNNIADSEAASFIQRKITDESGQYSILVQVTE
jgi:hypothetical protein